MKALSFITGALITLAICLTVITINHKNNGVDCIEHRTMIYDGYTKLECTEFRWKNETYKTKYHEKYKES